jgi:hypothetical protein
VRFDHRCSIDAFSAATGNATIWQDFSCLLA